LRNIVLISCVKKKLPYRSKAMNLYVSAWFKKALAYAKNLRPDAIYILSAKHGLLGLETEIEPYEATLLNMSNQEIQAWAKRVQEGVCQCCDIQRDHFIILAGTRYRRYLVPYLSSVEIPMEGMSIGKQLRFLKGGQS
jgi:hypothetical protein